MINYYCERSNTALIRRGMTACNHEMVSSGSNVSLFDMAFGIV